ACQPILHLTLQVRAELRRQQRAQHVNGGGLGERRRSKNEQRLYVLLDALLYVKANRIGWAVLPECERVSRRLQVILRLDHPFANHGDDRIRSGHTTLSLPAPPAIQSCRRRPSATRSLQGC